MPTARQRRARPVSASARPKAAPPEALEHVLRRAVPVLYETVLPGLPALHRDELALPSLSAEERVKAEASIAARWQAIAKRVNAAAILSERRARRSREALGSDPGRVARDAASDADEIPLPAA